MRIADALWRVLLIIHSEGVELLGLDSYEARLISLSYILAATSGRPENHRLPQTRF